MNPTTPTNSERLSLEDFRNKIVGSQFDNFEDAIYYLPDNEDRWKLEALESYHSQEMKFLQEEIDRLRHNEIQTCPVCDHQFETL